MRKEDNKQSWRQRLVIWVDGEREPKDRSLFVMERHPHRFSRPTDQEFETREKRRLVGPAQSFRRRRTAGGLGALPPAGLPV